MFERKRDRRKGPAMRESMHIQLRAVIFRDGEMWVAHCLEIGVFGHGETMDEALASMSEAVAIQVQESVEHDNLDNLFMSVDPAYLRMFFAGEHRAIGQLQVKPIQSGEVVIDGWDAREYREPRAMA